MSVSVKVAKAENVYIDNMIRQKDKINTKQTTTPWHNFCLKQSSQLFAPFRMLPKSSGVLCTVRHTEFFFPRKKRDFIKQGRALLNSYYIVCSAYLMFKSRYC